MNVFHLEIAVFGPEDAAEVAEKLHAALPGIQINDTGPAWLTAVVSIEGDKPDLSVLGKRSISVFKGI